MQYYSNDSIDRQRYMDRFQYFTRIPGSTQVLDAAITSMYLPYMTPTMSSLQGRILVQCNCGPYCTCQHLSNNALARQYIMQGLKLDQLENLRDYCWIDDVLELLKGKRFTDYIYDLLAAGTDVDPMIIAQAIFQDRSLDIKVAEIINDICKYRLRNDEAGRVCESIVSVKSYNGPIFNSVEDQANSAAMKVMKNEMIALYAMYGRI